MAKSEGNADTAEKPEKGEKGDKPAKAEKSQKEKGKGKGKDKDKGKGKAAEGPAQVYKREKPPRLKSLYDSEIRGKLRADFKYSSIMQVPRLVKISLNMGLGRANQNPKLMESGVEELRVIAGQAPVICLAKRDIATFKLRRGQKIGCTVTLRRERMWEFLDRLVNIALPRVRDFRGVSPRAFDGRGNFTLGVREQIIFPEINYDDIDSVKGVNITIVTTAATDEEGRALLTYLGMPFRRSQAQEQGAAA